VVGRRPGSALGVGVGGVVTAGVVVGVGEGIGAGGGFVVGVAHAKVNKEMIVHKAKLM